MSDVEIDFPDVESDDNKKVTTKKRRGSVSDSESDFDGMTMAKAIKENSDSDSEGFHPPKSNLKGKKNGKKSASEEEEDSKPSKASKSKNKRGATTRPRRKATTKTRAGHGSSDEDGSGSEDESKSKLPAKRSSGRTLTRKADSDEDGDSDDFLPAKGRTRPSRAAAKVASSRVATSIQGGSDDDGEEEEEAKPAEKVVAAKTKPGPASKTRGGAGIGNGEVVTLDSDDDETPISAVIKVRGGTRGDKKDAKADLDSDEEKKPKKSEDAEEDEDDESEEGDGFVVEKVLDKKIEFKGRGRKRKQVVSYLLSWKGFGPDENCWEPASNVFCHDLIAEYEASIKTKAADTKKETGSKYRAGPASKTKRLEDAAAAVSSPKRKKVEKNKEESETEVLAEDSDTSEKKSEDTSSPTKSSPAKRKTGPVSCECLYCAKTFEEGRGKKWTLATSLNVDLEAPVNVYEGLSTFYQHYKGPIPLTKLEPIGPLETEDRRLCTDCGKGLELFVQSLCNFTFRSNKVSKCAELGGDLDTEMADWKGLLEMEGEDEAEQKEKIKIKNQSDVVVQEEPEEESD